MSLHIIKAWDEGSPSNYFVIEAVDFYGAVRRLFEFWPECEFEEASLHEAYRGFAMLSEPEC
jgi:hypothetical protein